MSIAEKSINEKPRVLAVVGMHRSETSALVGLVEEAGVALGEVSRGNTHNARGNRADRAIAELNDRVLWGARSYWYDPPRREPRWTDDQLAAAVRIVEDHSERGIWGFKDSRTFLAVAGWKHACPHVEFIGSVRHPSAVAASLAAVQRLENGGDPQPHPCFAVTRVAAWRKWLGDAPFTTWPPSSSWRAATPGTSNSSAYEF